MGKSLPRHLSQIAKGAVAASQFARPAKPTKVSTLSLPKGQRSGSSRGLESLKQMESSAAAVSAVAAAVDDKERNARVPLSEVVSECVKRWFKDTLKEAKAGDINMQVLVGQMYQNGYGVPRDAQKGRAWMTRASRIRPSVWRVGDKRPGYNASDSDSDELKEDS
ncbi:hypothetical protein SAY87_031814 [Trapa incisa]|uniref:Sel1-like protein n=2 Tax=Trapa TaxID=22665 RepID=A0AAN7MC20_TRANT|nr:hypothetical protein SAY87_031814 [Trapa incisa]KAK4795637.1 hypothetical protein SAY86_027963 [Trapa natans]